MDDLVAAFKLLHNPIPKQEHWVMLSQSTPGASIGYQVYFSTLTLRLAFDGLQARHPWQIGIVHVPGPPGQASESEGIQETVDVGAY